MTIYNASLSGSQLDITLTNLSRTLQSLNNHLDNIKKPKKTLLSGDRYLARQEHAVKNDSVFGELAVMGLSSFTGIDMLEGLTSLGGGMGDALVEAAQDLHELDALNGMSQAEKEAKKYRRIAYEEELRQERYHEAESRKLRNMMTLMTMAVATLEERMKRREKRDAMKAFADNNRSISQKRKQAELQEQHVLTMNLNDIITMKAA